MSMVAIPARLHRPLEQTLVMCFFCHEELEYPTPSREGLTDTTSLMIKCPSCGTHIIIHRGQPIKSLNFPPELISKILEHLPLAYPTLLSTSLVSRMWHNCSTPLLYSHIRLEWNSRTGTRLLCTFDDDPTLFVRIKEIAITYPCLWQVALPGYDPQDYYDEEAERLGAVHPALEEADLQEQASVLAKRRWHKVVEEAGFGGWMDGGEEGEAPRREGARAFLD